MKRPPSFSTPLLCVLALGGAAAAAEGPALDPARAAAILPDAGFVAHVDVAALGDAALVKSLLPAEENEMLARLTSITGLAPRDILDILVSAESDAIEVQITPQGQHVSPVPGIMAVSLARPLATAELRSSLEAAWQGRREVSTSKAGEVEIVEVAAAGPETPPFYAASSLSGSVVFLANDLASLQGALERERGGLYAPVPPALEALESSLAPSRQAQFLLVTPPALRDRLKAPTDRAPTMVDRVLAPFQGLEGLALAASVEGDARLEIVGDLGDEASAQQAEELLSSFLVPNLLRAMSARLGVEQIPADAVAVARTGSLARISIRVRPEDVQSFLAARVPEGSAAPSR